MPGATSNLSSLNPLKKMIADIVFDAVTRIDGIIGSRAGNANVEYVSVRRVSDLRSEVTVHQKSSSFPPKQFTVLVIEHRDDSRDDLSRRR